MNHLAPIGNPAAPEQAAAWQPERTRHRRIADIELLRGLAVVMVLIEHLPLNLVTWHSATLELLSRTWHGWPGVDLFFVISGFVIGRSLLPMLSDADPLQFLNNTLAFWTRRAWRLLPSAWLWLVIPLLASMFFNRSGLFDTPLVNYRGLVAGLLDIANFRLSETFGRLPYGPSFPYWSLSLEEQFYLLLPLLLFVFRRHLPWVMALVLLEQFWVPHTPLSMVTRSGALAIGVLLAFWSATPSWRLCEPRALDGSRLARMAALLLPILLLGALGSEKVVSPGLGVGLIAMVAAIPVWVASYDQDYLMRGILPRRLMLWLGSRSYGIYLIHIPVFVATREIWFRLSPPGTVFDGRFAGRFGLTALLLLLLLSELNHRLVERPLRRHGAAIAGRMTARRILP